MGLIWLTTKNSTVLMQANAVAWKGSSHSFQSLHAVDHAAGTFYGSCAEASPSGLSSYSSHNCGDEDVSALPLQLSRAQPVSAHHGS